MSTVDRLDSRASGAVPVATSRHGFAVVVTVVLLVLSASSLPSPLYGLYQQRWGITPVASTVVYACYALGVVAALAGGRVLRGVHPRTLMAVALGSVVVSALVFVAAPAVRAPSVWALDVARVVQGLGTGMISGVAASALTALHPARNAGRAAAAASAATAGGIGLGAALSGALVQWAPAPLATPYLVLAGAAAIAACALPAVPAAAMGTHRPADAGTPKAPTTPRSLSPAARRGLRAAGPLVATSWAVTGIYLALGVELTGRLIGTDDRAVASLIIVLVQGAGGLVQVVLRRWPSGRAATVGCTALVVGTAASVAAVAAGLPAVFLAAAVVVGSGFGLCFLAALRITSEAAADDERTRAVRAFFLIAYVALSVPTVAAGLLEMHWGLDRTFMAFGSIVVVTCASAGVFAHRYHRAARRSPLDGSGR
jgi:MFS family permease